MWIQRDRTPVPRTHTGLIGLLHFDCSSCEHHYLTINLTSRSKNKMTKVIPISCSCPCAIICLQQGSCQTRKPATIGESTSEHLALQISIQTTIEIFDLLDNLQFREGNTNRYLLSRLERRETSVRTGAASKGITQPTLQESFTEITRGNVSNPGDHCCMRWILHKKQLMAL